MAAALLIAITDAGLLRNFLAFVFSSVKQCESGSSNRKTANFLFEIGNWHHRHFDQEHFFGITDSPSPLNLTISSLFELHTSSFGGAQHRTMNQQEIDELLLEPAWTNEEYHMESETHQSGSPTNLQDVQPTTIDSNTSHGVKKVRKPRRKNKKATPTERNPIWVEDGMLFPTVEVASAIGKIFLERLDDGAVSWGLVSEDTKNFYWEEFQKQLVWSNDIEADVKKAWRDKCCDRYRDRMYNVRSGRVGKKVASDETIKTWKMAWGTDNFKKKSEINRRNRKSEIYPDSQVSRQCSGRTPHCEIRSRLATKLDHEPHLWEVFVATHTTDDDCTQFIDERSKRFYDELNTVREMKLQNREVSESERYEFEKEIYLEALGKRKGNHIYGIGCLGRKLSEKRARASRVQELEEKLRRSEEEKASIQASISEQVSRQVNEHMQTIYTSIQSLPFQQISVQQAPVQQAPVQQAVVPPFQHVSVQHAPIQYVHQPLSHQLLQQSASQQLFSQATLPQSSFSQPALAMSSLQMNCIPQQSSVQQAPQQLSVQQAPHTAPHQPSSFQHQLQQILMPHSLPPTNAVSPCVQRSECGGSSA